VGCGAASSRARAGSGIALELRNNVSSETVPARSLNYRAVRGREWPGFAPTPTAPRRPDEPLPQITWTGWLHRLGTIASLEHESRRVDRSSTDDATALSRTSRPGNVRRAQPRADRESSARCCTALSICAVGRPRLLGELGARVCHAGFRAIADRARVESGGASISLRSNSNSDCRDCLASLAAGR